jgi:hypothetical protein
MSDDRLALAQVAPLFAYAAGTAGGQLLFKAAALRYAADAPPGNGSSASVFGEAITTPLLFGIVLILGGLLLVAS